MTKTTVQAVTAALKKAGERPNYRERTGFTGGYSVNASFGSIGLEYYMRPGETGADREAAMARLIGILRAAAFVVNDPEEPGMQAVIVGRA